MQVIQQLQTPQSNTTRTISRFSIINTTAATWLLTLVATATFPTIQHCHCCQFSPKVQNHNQHLFHSYYQYCHSHCLHHCYTSPVTTTVITASTTPTSVTLHNIITSICRCSSVYTTIDITTWATNYHWPCVHHWCHLYHYQYCHNNHPFSPEEKIINYLNI